METWRKHSFVLRANYRILVSFSSQTSNFAKGDIVQYVGAAYSIYDSSTAFMFKKCSSGETLTWFLHDDDDDDSAQLFREEKNQKIGV